MSDNTIAILFVCMGNICRSPAAEAVFSHLVEQHGLLHRFDIDSAGTGNWHAGSQADARSREEGARRGYSLTSRARQVVSADWERFDMIVCMDDDNRYELLAAGAAEEKVHLLMRWHPDSDSDIVPDPYYGGKQGFVYMYDLIEAACENLLQDILKP